MAQGFKTFLKNFLDILLLLDTFEILSLYPNIYNSLWLKEGVQCITDKIFIEKFMFYMASTRSSRTFLLKFRYLPVFVVLVAIRLIVMSY